MPSKQQRPVKPPRGPPSTPIEFPIVGIGASAGGLDACTKLISALPADSGLAFILVQHLDPHHESLMVDLLAGHTAMKVVQAANGMTIAPNHFYIIPPGTYLSVRKAKLHLSSPNAPHGARLPFDFLLHSMAEDLKARAIGVILSGTGSDGSLGLAAVRDAGGFVIAQEPVEAEYDGMPKAAIAAGAVDLILPIAKIAEALTHHDLRVSRSDAGGVPQTKTAQCLPDIIALLRKTTTHDFSLYKRGTLQRRIERRMALASIKRDDTARYLTMLEGSAQEIELLAKDLLINVTSFFRDPKVFDLLAEKIIPDLIRDQAADIPLRIWIAGCSTGEEAYSLAMLFREAITAVNANITLQVFASDVDADAVATARDGLYGETIKGEVSPARLARFFTKEDRGYRVSPELRTAVIFTVQDVLSDPPFSRLDLISCRNLLIYLGTEAQAKVISLFHFALRDGGTLLLGNAETVGTVDGRFSVISKPDRLYRHIGRGRSGDIGFSAVAGDSVRIPAQTGQGQPPSHQAALAELCQRLVLENQAPAAVLINHKLECLYSLGPTERFLRVAPGHPSHDVLAMAPQALRTKLRAAIQHAIKAKERCVTAGGQISHDGKSVPFSIDVMPVVHNGEDLLLICFVEMASRVARHGAPTTAQDAPRIAELELELDALKIELQGAIHSLEISGEEQRTINEEALSVNEEFQSTNEELLTSKEELQSLNEELTALNSQLQETLDRQRITSNDLQNVLYSTDVATVFLDPDLNIRFFTPATKALFNVRPGDVGRPLADLSSLSADRKLSGDARAVLQNLEPIDREIETDSGTWFTRRIMPYRADDDDVEGVVITFTDITDRKQAAKIVMEAKQIAEQATIAKSRFLAVASHDLRQPLQTLALLQGLLAKSVEGEKAQKLVSRVDETLGAMSGMLNTLLDINQIEAGNVTPDLVTFPINDLLERLRGEFMYHAQSQKLALHAVPCSLSITSDPRLLEQMIRNLISNALKYTKRGKVLIGCRRRAGKLSIEVWDTGVGIASGELDAVFDEYHQLDNAARERSRGLGLGLSIVKRLGILLRHPVTVRSQSGRGSVFAIEIALPERENAAPVELQWPVDDAGLVTDARLTGTILVIEDDPEVRDLLDVILNEEGHVVTCVADGRAALALMQDGKIQPDLILSDFNLPGGMNGLELAERLRAKFERQLPVIILTGDISTDTLRNIARDDCIQLNKPVKLNALTQAIQRLLIGGQPAPIARGGAEPVIYVVDDDLHIREAMRDMLEGDGRSVEDYADGEAFLAAYSPGREACLLIDAYLPGMSGLEILQKLNGAGDRLPAIMITGNSDVAMAVQAMKAGASDFIEKPIGARDLIASVARALDLAQNVSKRSAHRDAAAQHVAGLTKRQHQIMDMVLAGHPSKNIAADLGISQRTVENHRAAIMTKTGATSLPALARLALVAETK
jgi:two-component system, chemotaxis family, CheB/CheR fusion protein